MDGWIVIPGWDKFQHYKDRDPTWIKVYTELNSRADWLSCSCAARGLLVTCWLEYARSRGRLKVEHVASIAGAGYKHVYLKALNDAGFIDIVASEPAKLPSGAAVALARSREVEVLRTSTKSGDDAALAHGGASSPQQQLKAAAKRFAAGWNGGGSDEFDEGLDELEQLTGARLPASYRYRLWDEAHR